MLFLSSVSYAAPSTNKVVNFQGRLQTAAGAVVPDGYYNMQFKIYQDGPGNAVGNPGGALNWTESYVNNGGTSGVKVKNGLFSVSLGSHNAFGDSVDWSQDTLWLSMNIAGNSQACATFGSGSCLADGEMLPMKRISAVPYAISAGSVGGKTADDLVQIGQGTQTDDSDNASIAINKTGSGNLVELQSGAADVFTVGNAGDITMGSNADHSIGITSSVGISPGRSLTVSAGDGGVEVGGSGGDLVLQGGNAGGVNENGGNISVDAGTGNGTGSGGTISIGTESASAINIGNSSSTTTINGTFKTDTSQASNFDTRTASTLTIGGTNATSITMAKSMTVSAGQTITMIGGATALRPTDPDEGSIYYDSETKELLVYADNQWQVLNDGNGGGGDGKTASFIVAASDSSQAAKDNSDYVADGTNDQVEINSAISALPDNGGTIMLLGGTYNITDSIAISDRSDVTIQGEGGRSTTLKRMWNNADPSKGVITIYDYSYRTKISGLSIDGNKASYSSTNNHGIRIGDEDSGCGNLIEETIIDGNQIYNTGGTGIRFGSSGCFYSKKHTVTNNTLSGAGVSGIDSADSNISNTNIKNNFVSDSADYGIDVSGSVIIDGNRSINNGGIGIYSRDTVTNNIITGNAGAGVLEADIVTGNYICDNGSDGYYRAEGESTMIENNVICNNNGDGIRATGSSVKLRLVKNNDIVNNAKNGINARDGDDHNIEGNNIRNTGASNDYDGIFAGSAKIVSNSITDTVGTGCAIYIAESNPASYLSNNTYSGTGANCISDQDTDTIYVNQVDASGKLINRANGGFGVQTGAGSDAMTVDGTSGDVVVAGTLKAGSLATASVDTATAGNLALAASNATSVTIGTSDANATTLVLDTKTSTGDPTGVNGAMYYNSSAGKFRCYQASSWQDCVTPLPVYKTITANAGFTEFATDVTGMSFPLAANTKYQYKFVIQHGGTNGAGFGITSPAGSTGTNWCINATVRSPLPAAGQSSTAYCGTGDASTVISNSSLTGNSFVSIMEGYVETTGTPGDLVLRGKSTINGATVSSGTFGVVQIVR